MIASSVSAPKMHAFFRDGPASSGGQRLYQFYPALSTSKRTRGLLLYVHPFAEEMNKARRMAAIQSRALAQAGYAVLQLDLMGCGDSSGELADASWQIWIDDIVHAADWLEQQGDAPLWLWGLRSGCLLASAAARQRDRVCNFLFWQPTTQGKTLVQQFLRLKMAAELQGGQGKQVMEALRTKLASGELVEIAGYQLNARITQGMEAATLAPPPKAQRLVWMELSTRPDAQLLPISATTINTWQATGCVSQSEVVSGPAFWQTTEIEDAPALITATQALLNQAPRA